MHYAMHYSCLKNEFQAGRMAQQLEVPPARPDNLCSIPTWSKEKTDFLRYFPLPSHVHTQKEPNNNKCSKMTF